MNKGVLSLLMAIAILVSIPILFRKPATLIARTDQIALLAADVSMEDPVWTGGSLFPDWIFPANGSLSLGYHPLYPLEVATVRDVVSGDVLVIISSPFQGPEHSPEFTLDEDSMSIFTHGDETLVLVRGNGTPSWPAELFSVISNS